MHKFAVMLTSYVPYVCSAGAALCGVTLINPGGRGRGGGGGGGGRRGVGEALTKLTIPLPLKVW